MNQIESSLNIEGIDKSAIVEYFVTINQEEFIKTASLFTEDGELFAPFEKAIIGREKIAAYLSKEAKGMKLLPKQGICESTSDVLTYKVVGKVKTSMFSVNVAWHFTLDQDEQITTARIKLLASGQELLSLQSKRDR